MANWSKFKTDLTTFISNNFTSKTLKRPTYTTYSYETGQAETLTTVGTIKASIQDVREKDLKELPEGVRSFKTRKIYTTTAIRERDIIEDSVSGKSIQYEVMDPIESWQTNAIMFYKAFITRVENQTISSEY